jgi:hypothetical protein
MPTLVKYSNYKDIASLRIENKDNLSIFSILRHIYSRDPTFRPSDYFLISKNKIYDINKVSKGKLVNSWIIIPKNYVNILEEFLEDMLSKGNQITAYQIDTTSNNFMLNLMLTDINFKSHYYELFILNNLYAIVRNFMDELPCKIDE